MINLISPQPIEELGDILGGFFLSQGFIFRQLL